MASVHTVVVIGASFGGLPVAHALLKDILPASGKQYKLVLINPTDQFFWKIGAPRTLINPASLPLDKTLLPFLQTFEKYGDKFEFVKAYATAVDPIAKTVTTSTEASIHYDSLVIASGTSFASDLWSTSPGSDRLTAAIKDLHNRLPGAETIIVAGGGAAGVETAGELGEVYGGKKNITLLSGGTQLLNGLGNKDMGKEAQAKLEKMGLKVVHDVRVNGVTREGEKETLALSNGETKTVDVYIEATGDKPNSDFVPKEWRDEKGKIRTDGNTLRLAVPDVTGVYCVGSVGSYSNGGIMDTKMGHKALLESVKLDLKGQTPGPRTKGIYKQWTSDLQLVPVGSTQGVGIAFGWRLPSFMVKMAKSRDYMIGNAPKLTEGIA